MCGYWRCNQEYDTIRTAVQTTHPESSVGDRPELEMTSGKDQSEATTILQQKITRTVYFLGFLARFGI